MWFLFTKHCLSDIWHSSLHSRSYRYSNLTKS